MTGWRGGDILRNVECCHHVVILVHKVVAMEHVHTTPRLEVGNDLHLLVLPKVNDVLQSSRFIRLNSSSTSYSRHDLEVNEMDVDRVRPATRFVHETPSLYPTLRRLGQDTVWNVFKSNAVD